MSDFKKPPFKLEEQGWGEFDMAITLHFAEKGGTKDIAHDLHFQAPKYETTHVVVSCNPHLQPDVCSRNSPNQLLAYLNY